MSSKLSRLYNSFKNAFKDKVEIEDKELKGKNKARDKATARFKKQNTKKSYESSGQYDAVYHLSDPSQAGSSQTVLHENNDCAGASTCKESKSKLKDTAKAKDSHARIYPSLDSLQEGSSQTVVQQNTSSVYPSIHQSEVNYTQLEFTCEKDKKEESKKNPPPPPVHRNLKPSRALVHRDLSEELLKSVPPPVHLNLKPHRALVLRDLSEVLNTSVPELTQALSNWEVCSDLNKDNVGIKAESLSANVTSAQSLEGINSATVPEKNEVVTSPEQDEASENEGDQQPPHNVATDNVKEILGKPPVDGSEESNDSDSEEGIFSSKDIEAFNASESNEILDKPEGDQNSELLTNWLSRRNTVIARDKENSCYDSDNSCTLSS